MRNSDPNKIYTRFASNVENQPKATPKPMCKETASHHLKSIDANFEIRGIVIAQDMMICEI